MENKQTRQLTDRVFKTNERRGLRLVIDQSEDRVVFAESEISRDPFAREQGKKRKRFP
jgi:hypothetical protein